jgi:histidinol-phosphate/aromatic aminotransferase/cobyric acid decarboxylase-like protein
MAKRTTVIVDEAYLEFEPDFAQKTAMELTRSAPPYERKGVGSQ